ncbi:DUF2079 domain-containing protein [Saccharopolyspora hattusasensis]|uniref:DUF2079 domain-containing protein n=1 Tax=Saccharopolyspora hattusasensis TaxID=1128679 RepID=UPI003D96A87D
MSTTTFVPTTAAGSDRRAVSNQAVLFLLWAAFFACYAWISLARYAGYASMSFDLGIFEQVVRSYAEGRTPVADLLGPGFVIFGDHFSPALALLAPLYFLFPSAQTLLVAQAALFALSIVPVTRAATRLLGDTRGRSVGVAYGLAWGVQRAVDFDFHEICFAVPLVAFALEAALSQRWWRALLLTAPLVLVKDDLALTGAAIALVLAWLARQHDKRFARVAVVSAVLFVVAWFCITLLVIPSFNATGEYRYWDKISGDVGFPASLLEGWDEKFSTALWLLIPTTGLLALRSPVLLAVLPTLGWRFASLEEHYWSADWHYNAVLMPILTFAMVDAIVRVRATRLSWLRGYASHLPGLVLAAAVALTVTLPIGKQLQNGSDRFQQDPEAASRVLAMIPDGATVVANNSTIAHLTGRCRVFWPGNTYGIVPDYVAIYEPDKTAADVREEAAEWTPGTTYQVLLEDSGFWALGRTT